MLELLPRNITINGTTVDIIFILVVVYFMFTSKGLLDTFLEVIGFILSLILSYKLYTYTGNFIAATFNVPPGIANALGFFVSWFFIEITTHIAIVLFSSRLLYSVNNHPINKKLGFISGILQAFVLFLFFVSFIFAFPVRGEIKQAILDSHTGPVFVNLSQASEKRIKNIFGEAISETINFMTIKPESGETLQLGFKVKETALTIDTSSEDIMLNLINQERTSRGFKPLEKDTELQQPARDYAKKMLINGFFSHTSQIDGSSPGERADRYKINYFVLGENLAYAPDVYLSHQGLMNSEGHRKNILSPDFGRVGIGVIDAGIYGKMFVQEFRD